MTVSQYMSDLLLADADYARLNESVKKFLKSGTIDTCISDVSRINECIIACLKSTSTAIMSGSDVLSSTELTEDIRMDIMDSMKALAHYRQRTELLNSYIRVVVLESDKDFIDLLVNSRKRLDDMGNDIIETEFDDELEDEDEFTGDEAASGDTDESEENDEELFESEEIDSDIEVEDDEIELDSEEIEDDEIDTDCKYDSETMTDDGEVVEESIEGSSTTDVPETVDIQLLTKDDVKKIAENAVYDFLKSIEDGESEDSNGSTESVIETPIVIETVSENDSKPKKERKASTTKKTGRKGVRRILKRKDAEEESE